MTKIKKLYERPITDLSLQCVWHMPAYKTEEHMKEFKKEHEESEAELYIINGPTNDEIVHTLNKVIEWINQYEENK